MNGLSAEPNVGEAISSSALVRTPAPAFAHDTWWSEEPSSSDRQNSGEEFT